MKSQLSCLLSSVLALILTSQVFGQTDSTYFYLSGVKHYFCQQPDMYSFRLTDFSKFSDSLDATTVMNIEYFGIGDGIHNIHFYPTSPLIARESVIANIMAHPDFEKEFMVATKTLNFGFACNSRLWMGTDMQIEVVFDDPDMTFGGATAFAAGYQMDLVFAPDNIIADGVYVLQVKKNHKQNPIDSPTLTLDIAAQMWENDSSILKKVTPSLRIFYPDDPNDPLYPDMWFAEGSFSPYLCNGSASTTTGIDLDCAWNFQGENDPFAPYYSGDGIVVGVIDWDGVEYSHPDCASMFIDGYVCTGPSDFIFDINDDHYWAGPIDDRAHLQCVSGIIGARGGNSEGGIGIAHNCEIIPCLFMGTTGQFSALLQTLLAETGAREVDIINFCTGYYGITNAEAISYPFYTATLSCYLQGRPVPFTTDEFRGIVLVTSSGNDNGNFAQIPASLPEWLSVAATNPIDQVKTTGDGFDYPGGAYGSSYFEYLDVAAPGICIPTTDFTNTNPAFPAVGGGGYIDGNYFSFLGTSAAAPIVSGIAALVLEKNSALTNEQVYDAIRYSCEKVGGYSYSNPTASGRCLELGFGRVNACEALQTVDQLSVEELTSSGLVVSHSNPTEDFLQVSVLGSNNYSVSLFSVTGQLVYFSEENSSTFFEIDVSKLSGGVYYLNILDADNSNRHHSVVVKP